MPVDPIIWTRRAIVKFMRLSWTAVKRKQKLKGFPLHYDDSGRAYIVVQEVFDWFTKNQKPEPKKKTPARA